MFVKKEKVTIFDVAKFIFDFLDRPTISQMKLYKLLWFCQGWHFNATTQPLFDQDFVAWDYGPVPKDLWYYFKGKTELIEEDFEIENANDKKITGDSKEIVETVLNGYGDFTTSGLRQISLECDPWIKRHNNISNKAIIPKNEIKDYFCGL